MTTLLTIFFDLALPWFLWVLWRAAERADLEVETLTQRRYFADTAPRAADESSKSDLSSARY